MNSALAPNRLAEPPPLDLDLVDSDERVGWMTRDVIGFCGFGSDVEAVYAVWLAHRTLSRRLAKRDGRRPVSIDTASLYLRRDNNSVHAGDRKIGTLVRPGPDSPSGPETFGFELQMPSSVDEVEIRATALVVYRTLRNSGIRWSASQGGDRPSPRFAAAALDVAHAADGLGKKSSIARPQRRNISPPSSRHWV